MTKPVLKPTRSMPKIDMEQGDSMDEGEGHEEWLSDGGYTDDDTFTQDQDITSSQEEPSTQPETTNLETTPQVPPQVEETVENINNQLQLEINIGEDGVAVIRRQAVRVAEESISPQKVALQKESSEPPGSPSIFTAAPPAAATTSASEGTADDEEHSAEDPEKLLDQLETFLIRKTDGKVLGTKATVQTTLNDLVMKTVDGDGDERDDEKGDEDGDGNDTDDLLSVLDDSVSRRTTRSLAKLQQTDTANAASTPKDKTSTQANKQVPKSAESSKATTSLRRSITRSSSSSVSSRKDSQDDKPVILSNKVVHMSNKLSSNKKTHSDSKTSQTKSDKNTNKVTKDILVTNATADEDLIKHFAKKNIQKPIQEDIPLAKVDDPKKPIMSISNTNFGDTYTTFIQKQSAINKNLENQKSSNIKKLIESPKVYKRKVSTKDKEVDPFDKLLQSDNEENSQKIKRLSVDSLGKSPVAKKPHLETLDPKFKSKLEATSNLKPSTKTSEGTNKILSKLEKNTGLSVKSTGLTGNNKVQSITRKPVTELPKNLSPKVVTQKVVTPKVQSPIIQSTKPLIRSSNDSPIIQNRSINNISIKTQPISPLGRKLPVRQNGNQNLILNRDLTPKSYQNKAKMVDKKDFLNKSNLCKDEIFSNQEESGSEFEDRDKKPTLKTEWPGSPDVNEITKSEQPQRNQAGAISKTAQPMKAEFGDRDDESTDFDSDDMDYSEFDDMSASDSESMHGDMFTIDLRDERAAEYLPLLGAKAQEILEREKRSLLQKLTTIRQGLKSLQDNAKKNQSDIEVSKLKITELNTLIRQP